MRKVLFLELFNTLLKNQRIVTLFICIAISALFLGCDTEEDIVFFPERKLEDVSIISSDINLFWSLVEQSNGVYLSEYFKNNYFLNGTNALEEYFFKKISNAEMLTNKLQDLGFNEYYTSIKQNSLNTENIKFNINNALVEFNVLYPKANFSDIFLLIGPFASGGTVLNNGDIAIGVEFFMKSNASNQSGLPDYLEEVLKPNEYLETVVIHELVHLQQLTFAHENNIDMSNRSLLEITIAEGVAEYISFLVTDRFITANLSEYFIANEEELKQRFISEMNSSDYSNWLFNLGSGIDMPADLGYYIGFKIAEKHYENHHSIGRLIEIEDVNQFLIESGYLQ